MGGRIGTLAKELGFMVIRLQTEFPDCEAFREVEPGRWQRGDTEKRSKYGNLYKTAHFWLRNPR
ncbi:MAG TPA: hypothetical protein VGP89_10245 [Candidatus Angelobacter sp.]|nr:hypothetical protein [Candidatus Angelobacter sp.]